MVLSRPFDSFQDHCIWCIFVYIFNIFGAISSVPKPNKSKHVQIQIFKFHCAILCLLCTRMSKFDRVLKTHSNRDNSNNNSGRLFKFTSEVTLIGPHIVSKFQPNPSIFGKVIHHFVHGSFFQDHPHRVPLCV